MRSPTKNSGQALQRKFGLEQGLDLGFVWLTRICALGILGLLLWLAVQVGIEAFPAIQQFGVRFLVTSVWNPVTNQYGALPLIYGTLVTSAIALLLAWPVGIGIAIFLSEDFLPGSVRIVLVFLVELLAAIPSVVYGLWGIFVLIPILQVMEVWLNKYLGWLPIFSTYPTGPGILPAGVILSIMILPTISALSRQVLVSLSTSGLREAAYGLGATRWETIFKVLLPAGAAGIIGATVLAVGRAMGETMAVTMVIGNSGKGITPSLFSPGYTISALIANQFTEAVSSLEVNSLLYAALILFGLTFLVNVIAELLLREIKRTHH